MESFQKQLKNFLTILTITQSIDYQFINTKKTVIIKEESVRKCENTFLLSHTFSRDFSCFFI